MLNEEKLRAAAAISAKAYVCAAEADCAPAEVHIFSPAFERKIKKLARRAEHIRFHRFAVRAASVLLALLLSATVWLAFDSQARAAFFGWVREIYETHFVYRYDGLYEGRARNTGYLIPEAPEGYEMYKDQDDGCVYSAVFTDEAGNLLKYRYIYDPEGGVMYQFKDTKLIDCRVGEYCAEIAISNDTNHANVIFWTDENDHMFIIQAFLEPEELVELAESICSQKEN